VTPQNPITKSIVLIGMMGAGKSSIGRRLATRLSLPFIDADAEIEAAAGCSIAEIFERHGEEEFRAGERRVVARLLGGPPHVLATGGGAFMNEQTRDIIRDRGISIWLRADLDVLLQRVSRRNDRPMLQAEDQRARLVELMEQRDPWYAHADLVVESTDGPLEQTADRVYEVLEQYLTANETK
jgi:shikimate kinase